MSEYNDAIQRLNMPERPLGTTINRRDRFPVPRKDTAMNWNYIFRNTGNMNIPKYSIPQNLIIINNNSDYVLKQAEEINNEITSLNNEISEINDKLTEAQNGIEHYQTEYDKMIVDEPDNEEELNKLLDGIQHFQEELSENQAKLKPLQSKLEAYQEQLTELSYDSKTIFQFPLDEQFIMTPGNRKSIAIRAINIEAVEYETEDEEGDTIKTTDDVTYVASTINPWSKNNIIGRIVETFHNMPRLFPWDGQKYITAWFLDSKGERLTSPSLKGSIELELIIDNENTFGYE